jgi:beta-phosphoglucomutase-like phosphatase (HAD superfamily)
MDFTKLKLNNIEFSERAGKTFCAIRQGGIPVEYEWLPAVFRPPAKALLMDLDGTTALSEEFWIWLIEKVVGLLIKNPGFKFTREDIPFVSGFSAVEHFTYCIQKYRIDATPLQANALYHSVAERELNEVLAGRGNADAFRPRAGLKEFLTRVRADGVKIGLVTSGPDYKAVPEIVSIFRQIDMGDPIKFYDAVITGGRRKGTGEYGTVGELAAKPHPWVYAEIGLGMSLTDKESAVVLEDSSAGVISARIAGYPVIGLNDGNIVQSGLDAACFAMADTLDDVYRIMNGLT